MKEHEWIVEVCEDLKAYALEHQLWHLVSGLDATLNAARLEILLRSSGSARNQVTDYAVLGSILDFHEVQTSSPNGAL